MPAESRDEHSRSQTASNEPDPDTNQSTTLSLTGKPPAKSSDSFSTPTVRTASPSQALHTAATHLHQPYDPTTHSLTFWISAHLPSRKTISTLTPTRPSAHRLCSFSIVHRRWDVLFPAPGDSNWDNTWWLSGYIATSTSRMTAWTADAMAVIHALSMAVQHCKRVSGAVVLSDRLLAHLRRGPPGLPNRVDVFCGNADVVTTLGGSGCAEEFSHNKALIKSAREKTSWLGRVGVGVNLHWVPRHSDDQGNAWAHEGARIAMNSVAKWPHAFPKSFQRVMVKVRHVVKARKSKRRVLERDDWPLAPEADEGEQEGDGASV